MYQRTADIKQHGLQVSQYGVKSLFHIWCLITSSHVNAGFVADCCARTPFANISMLRPAYSRMNVMVFLITTWSFYSEKRAIVKPIRPDTIADAAMHFL